MLPGFVTMWGSFLFYDRLRNPNLVLVRDFEPEAVELEI
jgi:hypothetical protein